MSSFYKSDPRLPEYYKQVRERLEQTERGMADWFGKSVTQIRGYERGTLKPCRECSRLYQMIGNCLMVRQHLLDDNPEKAFDLLTEILP